MKKNNEEIPKKSSFYWIKNKVLYILLGLLFIFVNKGQAISKVLISEVAPSQIADDTLIDEGDFIELFVVEDTNLAGYKLREGSKVIFTFPSSLQVVPSSSILLIHVNGKNNLSKATDETLLKDNNQNRCIDFYSTDSGLTATDNTISLSTSNDILVDFLSYANQDKKWTGSSTWYEKAILSSQWIGNSYEVDSFDSSKLSKDYSIGRNNKLEDTNRKDDWLLDSIITPGKANPGLIEVSILLNEIAPNEEYDWIEIYNNSNKDLELDYLILKEEDKIIKVFFSLNLKKDDFLVVKLNSQENSENFATLKNNSSEFYSSYASIANTDSVITLEDGIGNIIDALLYSNQDGTLSAQNKEAANRVVKAKKWQVDNMEDLKERDFIYWDGQKGHSLFRKYTEQTLKGNWSICSYPTMGKGNQVKDGNLTILNFKIENNLLFIDNSYPSKEEAKIIFNLSQEAFVSLQVYNVEGVAVKEILRDNFLSKGEHIYSWKGRDKEDNLVPIGIYVVYLEVRLDKQSNIKKDTVVVTKKL